MGKSTFVAVLAMLISGLAQAQTQTQTQYQPWTQTSEDRPFQIYALAGLGHSSGGPISFRLEVAPTPLSLRGSPSARNILAPRGR
jgi:hypothetical protein